MIKPATRTVEIDQDRLAVKNNKMCFSVIFIGNHGITLGKLLVGHAGSDGPSEFQLSFLTH